jgi:hypothetical protein
VKFEYLIEKNNNKLYTLEKDALIGGKQNFFNRIQVVAKYNGIAK